MSQNPQIRIIVEVVLGGGDPYDLSYPNRIAKDTYPYLRIRQVEALIPSFHLNQWGPSAALGSPRNAYLTAD